MSENKAEELIRFIYPNKRLAVALAITFAWKALPVFESRYPDELKPRKAIELSWRWLAGGDVSKRELYDAADAASYIFIKSASAYATAYSAAYSAANVAYAAEAYTDAYATTNAADAAYWADKALGNNIIPDLIQSLIPLMIDYAIQNQIKLFTGPGNFDEVFESLPEDYRDKVWYNMELFGK